MKFLSSLKSQQNTIYWLLFFFGLTFLIFIQYYGLVHYHYPVPPGHDAAVHYNMAQPFFEGKINFWSYLKSGLYPPGFLILISSLAHLFNTDTLAIMLWMTPLIIPLASLVLFFLSKQIFGRKVALAAFFLYSFAASINIQQLNDGGYPNLIAAQILLPLFLILLFSIRLKEKLSSNIIKIILGIIILVSIPLTHHLTTLYIIVITALLVPAAIIYFWIVNKWSAKKGISYFVILFALITLAIFAISQISIFASTLELAKQNVKFLSSFPFIKFIGQIDPEATVSIKSLPGYIGYPVFIFGIIGLIIVIGKIWRQKVKNIFPVAVLVVWALILLAGSRLTFFSNPDRLARDLVFPLAILAGVGLIYVYELIISKKWYIALPLAMIATLTILIPLKKRLVNAFRYEPMVRVTTADISTIDYLKTQPKGKILIEGYSFYYHSFLPGWDVVYLYVPQTVQLPNTHVFDPTNSSDLAKIKEYNYIYVVDQQNGWVPMAVTTDFAGLYLNNPNFKLVKSASSGTNKVYLFKVLP